MAITAVRQLLATPPALVFRIECFFDRIDLAGEVEGKGRQYLDMLVLGESVRIFVAHACDYPVALDQTCNNLRAEQTDCRFQPP